MLRSGPNRVRAPKRRISDVKPRELKRRRREPEVNPAAAAIRKARRWEFISAIEFSQLMGHLRSYNNLIEEFSNIMRDLVDQRNRAREHTERAEDQIFYMSGKISILKASLKENGAFLVSTKNDLTELLGSSGLQEFEDLWNVKEGLKDVDMLGPLEENRLRLIAKYGTKESTLIIWEKKNEDAVNLYDHLQNFATFLGFEVLRFKGFLEENSGHEAAI